MQEPDEIVTTRPERLAREDMMSNRARAILRQERELQDRQTQERAALQQAKDMQLQIENRKRKHAESHERELRRVEELAIQEAREKKDYEKTHHQMEIVREVAKKKKKTRCENNMKVEEEKVEDKEAEDEIVEKKDLLKKKPKKNKKQKETKAVERAVKDEELQQSEKIPSPTREKDEGEDAELLKWFRERKETAIQDLVYRELTEEYHQWVQAHDAYCTQYYKAFCDVEDESSSSFSESDDDTFHLTRQSVRVFEYAAREEAAWRQCKTRALLQDRKDSLNVLKNKMAESKLAFFCHREERQRLQAEPNARAVAYIKSHLQIDVPAGSDVVKKFMQYMRERKLRDREKLDRYLEIAQRLLNEERRKHWARENKTAQARRWRQMQEKRAAMVVPKGTHKDTDELAWETDVEEEEHKRKEDETKVEIHQSESKGKEKEEDEKGDEEDREKNKKGKSVKKGRGKGTGSGGKISEGQKRNKKKEKKDKKGKGKKGNKESKKKGKNQTMGKECKDIVYVPPPEPVRRSRVGPDNVMVPDLMDVFQQLELRAPPPTPEPPDPEFTSKPASVLFKDFSPGRLYRSKVLVTNIGPRPAKCRLDRVQHSDGTDPQLLQVEALDACVVRTGLSFSIQVLFRPLEATMDVEGRIVFVTRRVGSPDREFHIPMRCQPSHPEVEVVPTELRFPTIPSWTGKVVQQCRYLQVVNSGGRPCSFGIHKIPLPEEEDTGLKQEAVVETPAAEPRKNEAEELARIKKRKSRKKSEPNPEPEVEQPMTTVVEPANQALHVVSELLEECMQNVFQEFRFDRKYYITVPARGSIRLQVCFEPREMSFYQEKFLFKFDSFCPQVEVTLVGETTALPFRLLPSVMDLRVCCWDGGVCQGSFFVFSFAKVPSAVSIRLPAALRRHVSVHPREALLQPGEEHRVSVRLAPRWRLAVDAPEFYDESTEILEFPICVQPKSFALGDCAPLKLHVLAVVTSPHAVSLLPATVDFGTVTTFETVTCPLQLTNRSKAVHKFGFLDLPQGVSVQPGDGFGTIMPEETVSFQLLYSPAPSDGPQHKFTVKCATIAALGGTEPAVDTGNTEPPVNAWDPEPAGGSGNTEPAIGAGNIEHAVETGNTEPPFDTGNAVDTPNIELPVDAGKTEVLEEPESEVDIHNPEIPEVQKQEHGLVVGGPELPVDIEHPEPVSRRTEAQSGVVLCVARVTSPACQLSCNWVQFPPTPCGSFSLAHVTLRATAAMSCHCGLVKTLEVPNRTRFEFKSLCDQVMVAPHSGLIAIGQNTKITLVFRPFLRGQDIDREARVLKASRILQERQEAELERESSKGGKDKKSKEDKKRLKGKEKKSGKAKLDKGKKKEKGKKEKRKLTVSSEKKVEEEAIDPASLEIEPRDLFPAEKSLLEALEPYLVTTTVDCLLQSADNGDTCRPGVLRLALSCPVVRPDFLLRCDSQRLDFGLVAVGTRPRQILRVQNIGSRTIKVNVSLLNPVGPFSCPPAQPLSHGGPYLDPEHILSLPITFAPQHAANEVKEYLEVRGGRTVVSLVLSGTGIVPQFCFSPDFLLYRFEGKNADCTVEIRNSCAASLPFRVQQVSVAQGVDRPTSSLAIDKKKEIKKKMVLELSSDDEEALARDFAPAGGLETVFSLVGVSERNELLVPAFQKAPFTVRFFSPGAADKKYAAKYRVTLEGRVGVKDLIFVATPGKKKGGAESKKGGKKKGGSVGNKNK